jgi:hypothetical protein
VKPFAKWAVWTSSILTVVTGLIYLWMDRAMEPMNEFAVINHPWQPFMLKAHILVAPLLVFALGLIATDHIWRYFRGTMRRARLSGLTAMWPVVPMVVTGYLIQAITHESWLEAVAWTHIAGGSLFGAALAAHQVAVRRARLVTLQLRVKPDLVDETEPAPRRPDPREPGHRTGPPSTVSDPSRRVKGQAVRR